MFLKERQRIIVPTAIAATALLARVIYDLQLRAHDPTFTMPLMDARWHFQWAMGISQGDFWGKGVFFRAPLYPYFLALIFRLFGPDFLAVRLIQACLGSVTAMLIYGLGSRLGGRRVGLVAGVIAAIYGPLIYFDGELLIETLYLPLVSGSLLLALHAIDAGAPLVTPLRRFTIWAISGLLMGLAAIARPNILIFAPVLIGWIGWELKSWRWLKPSAVWVIAFIIPVAVVTVRNGVVGGEYVLIASQGGVNFWIGNNALADGKTAMAPAHFGTGMSGGSLYQDSVDLSARLEAERQTGRKLNTGEISGFWFGQAFVYIEKHPLDWLKLTLKKIYFLTNGYEIPSNRDLYRVRDWALALRFLMIKNPIALPFGLIFPLAMAGMIFAMRGHERQNRSTHRLLALFLLTYSATVIGFFVTARHRLPILISLMPYAALALARFSEALHNSMRRGAGGRHDAPLRWALAVFLVAFAVSNTRAWGVRDDRTRELHMGLGEVLARQGRFDEALSEFQSAIREDPGIDRAWFNLGVTFLELRRYEEAMDAFRRTLAINPSYAPAWSHIGNIYFGQGRFDLAEESYLKALSMDPALAVAHYNLALTLRKKGDMAGYVAELETAVRSDPYFVAANLDLAHIYISQGRAAEARDMLKRVLRVDPQNRRAKEYLQHLSTLH